jgi:hypothetical protein
MWKQALLVATVAGAGSHAVADDHHREGGGVVAGTLATHVVPCASLCTESTWTGPLAGTSQFSLISIEDAQIPGENVSRFHGDLVLTTRDGELIGQDLGLWNLDTGAYVDVYTVTAGTGRLTGAHGVILLQGTLDPATGVGDSRYLGAIERGHRR